LRGDLAVLDTDEQALMFGRFKPIELTSRHADCQFDGKSDVHRLGRPLDLDLELDQRDLVQRRRVQGLRFVRIGDRRADGDDDLFGDVQRYQRHRLCRGGGLG
jgi:hypothetical protein